MFLHLAYAANTLKKLAYGNGDSVQYTCNVQVVKQSYDAWGNVLTTTGSLGKYNPLRYRGYVYDVETRLYYLQSRYYSPEWGRFINADALASTGQGLLGNNMFAYCNNNPINLNDPDGQDPVLIAAAGGAFAGALIALYYSSKNDLSFGETLLAMAGGAIAGALGGAVGMVTGSARTSCIIGAAVVSGLTAMYTGGSFIIGSTLGYASAYLGSTIDTSMYAGMELCLANTVTALSTGFPAEMASQEMHQERNEFLEIDTSSTITGSAGNTTNPRGMWSGSA